MEREITDDYYAVLEISPKATDDEIKVSYRRLALQKHPDKNVGNANATAEFQQINAAYQCLSDPKKRAAYDEKRVEVREEYSRRARTTGQDEVNLLKRKIAYLKSTLENLGRSRAKLAEDRDALKHQLIRILQHHNISYGELMTQGSGEAWWQNMVRAVTRDLSIGRFTQATEAISSLRTEIARHSIAIQNVEAAIMETELHLAILSGERRRQQWPAPPPSKGKTARQAEAERMQAQQRSQWAQTQKMWERERESSREAQRAAARAKQAAKREEQKVKEEAKAKIGHCAHSAFWNKVPGRHSCKNCFKTSDRVFACPKCSMVVCKGCRNVLNNRKKDS
ncbi:DnaJ domain-containing protein [Pestalotiopsis sp. NC0098]|nr:DnaJ domain-containing protein [Pestalotiopsis sp. NC0098]